MKEPFIWLQTAEESGTAACGCKLTVDYDHENPMLFMCKMHSAAPDTTLHLCEVLEWAKGLRGRKDINPYSVPEIKAALIHLAALQGIPDYLDAVTEKGETNDALHRS